MTKERYIALMNFWQNHKKLLGLSAAVQKTAELLIYFFYPAFVTFLFFKGDIIWLYSFLDCGIGFALVSVLRKLLNCARPYEAYGVLPAVKKDTKGCSFPSRHAFSAAVIAVNVCALYPVIGAIILGMAIVIATLRVLLGFHYIKDVLVGFILGVMAGSLVFLA